MGRDYTPRFGPLARGGTDSPPPPGASLQARGRPACGT